MSNSERPSRNVQRTCQMVRDLLPFVQPSGGAYAAPEDREAELYEHLAQCASCREEHEALEELIDDVLNGRIPPSPSYPPVELFFLSAPEPPPEATAAWRVDALGNILFTCSRALLGAFAPPFLTRDPRTSVVFRQQIMLAAHPDIQVSIEALESAASVGSCRIHICVELQHREPLEQAGIPIIVRAGDRTWTIATDAAGNAVVPDVPRALLPDVQIEIRPPYDDDI